MSRARTTLLAALILAPLAQVAGRTPLVTEYPGAMPAFIKACVDGPLTFAARETVVAADGWTPTPVSVDVENFNASATLDHNFDFSKPTEVKEWSRTIDGVTARVVLASFPASRRYPTLCGLVVGPVRQGWMYAEPYQFSMKSLGLKIKSTDFPHYLEYSGKIDNGTHPVRSELSGRTRVVTEKDAMHVYIAF